jgi:hypothetical protein
MKSHKLSLGAKPSSTSTLRMSYVRRIPRNGILVVLLMQILLNGRVAPSESFELIVPGSPLSTRALPKLAAWPLRAIFRGRDEYRDVGQLNKARTDIRNFLTQRAVQSFIFLLSHCRDTATVRWIEVSHWYLHHFFRAYMIPDGLMSRLTTIVPYMF